ncbi:hypothetical protein D3C76_1444030 [compost metagenome]
MSNVVAQTTSCDEKETKLLGAHVPKHLYWKFKTAAGARNENMVEAIINAALLYIDISADEGGKIGD